VAIDPLNLAGTAKLTFKAAFVSLSLWNGTSGTWATDYWYNPVHGNGGTLPDTGEQEWYINANAFGTQSVRPWTIVNNRLRLTLDVAPENIRPLIDGYKFTSGEVNTFHTFSQTYGYFEMRAKVPAVYGLWSAFWLKRENGIWPPELDIMEVLGRDTKTLHVNVHSRLNARKGLATNDISESMPVPVPDTSVAFHTYGVDWEANLITWYFDRQPVFTVDTPADMHEPMYIQADLAGGGPWAMDIDTSKLPGSFEIDYIKAWSARPPSERISSESDTIGTVRHGCTGKTLVADGKPGQVLKGTRCDDTFYAGDNSVVMEGRGGRDRFIFSDIPSNPGQITDFHPSLDKIDVSALVAIAGYKGTTPFSYGLFAIMPTLAGGSTLHFYPAKAGGNCCDYTIVTLDNVLPSQLDLTRDFVVQ
jgi:beta-glucanase (GH16 family)